MGLRKDGTPGLVMRLELGGGGDGDGGLGCHVVVCFGEGIWCRVSRGRVEMDGFVVRWGSRFFAAGP